MNKEQNKDESIIAEETKKLEDRIVDSFLAKSFTIANYNGHQVIFVHGERDHVGVDVIMTIDGAKEMAQAILETNHNEQSGELDSLARP